VSFDANRRRKDEIVPRRSEGVDTDSFRLYLRDVSRYPLLSKDEEVRLAKAIEAGREAAGSDRTDPGLTSGERLELRRVEIRAENARQVFVSSNLRLVVFIAKRYQSSGVPLLDLVQEGNLGLIHAVEKFDWRRGFKFSTYATWWIRQAVSRGIANMGRTVRLPVGVADMIGALQQAQVTLESRLHRQPTIAEISLEADFSEEKVLELLGYRSEPLSLSHPLLDDGAAELGDLVEDPTALLPFDEAALALLPQEIDRLLAPLTPRESEILRLRFGLDSGDPRTLEQVGNRLNVSRERIRQIEARALSKLRHPFLDTGARDLLIS
jgi:RNA polymerase sigma factor (sigma-70 family)